MRNRLATPVSMIALTLASANGHAGTTIAVLPPDTAQDKAAFMNAFARALTSLATGDQIIVYSARGAQIATIRLPTEDPRASNPSWVKRKLADQFAPVARAILTMPSTPPLGDIPENIAIPDLLDEIGRNVVPTLTDGKVNILLIGSQLYFDPRDGRFGMTDRFYPSDQHVRVRASDSPFGTAGLSKRLAGSVIHYCWPGGQSAFATKAHEDAVRRHWSNWTQAQGGIPGTFSYDLNVCMKRALAGDASGQTSYTLSNDTKLEMLRARGPLATRVPANMAQPGEYFLRDDVSISRTPPSGPLGIAWVGLKWSAPCDIDLYARAEAKNNWLFFGNVRSDDGLFNKDFTNSTGEKSFEYIEFTRAIDLNKTEVAINLYDGALAGPPEGVIRVWFDSKVYESPFKIAATRGNRGAMPIGGANWLKIDLRKIVGLPGH